MAGAALLLGERSTAGFLPIFYVTINDQRPIVVATLVTYALLGGLLTFRRPRLLYGWLWAWLGFTLLYIEFSRWYTAYDIFVARRHLPLLDFSAWLSSSAWFTAMALFSYMFLLFPAGKLPSPRWRWLARSIPLVAFVGWLSGAFLPGFISTVPLNNPYPWLRYPYIAPTAQLRDVSTVLLLAAVALSATSVFWRLRRAKGLERAQLKVFGYAALIAALLVALNPLLYSLDVRPYTADLLSAAGLILLFVAMSVAILRHHLFDVDLIIRRTLAYTVVTIFLGTFYLGTVILLQTVLVQLTGQSSPLALVLSTLAIAALFNPLRLRVQGWVDRRYFRQKYDSQLVLDAFAHAARDETDLDRLSAELTAVVRDTMQPTTIQVWLRQTATDNGS